MKVIYLTAAGPKHFAGLAATLAGGIEIQFLPPEDAPPHAAGCRVVVAGIPPREFLAAATGLEYLVIPFTGVPQKTRENLADYPEIKIINSHFNAVAAAEHAWGLLLAAAKRIVPADRRLRAGDWSMRYGEFPSLGLAGAQLLLVGYGAIGRVLGRMGKAFGMRVTAVKRTPGHAAGADFLGTPQDLPRLLPAADAIIVSLPGTPSTESCIGEEQFAAMKPGAIFVNVGRGAAVNEDAFHGALSAGRLGAAAIDTWWNYPRGEDEVRRTRPSRHALEGFENLVMSPHRASHTAGREGDRQAAVAGILNALAAAEEPALVDRQVWY